MSSPLSSSGSHGPAIELDACPVPAAVLHARRAYNAHEYAVAVGASAQVTALQSLYPRNHFKQLARYLCSARDAASHEATKAVNEPEFVTLLDLRPKQSPQHISSITEFESLVSNGSDREDGQILIMRGLPSPEWLCAIGAGYPLDPDFFRRHLDFRPACGCSNFFSDPYLPSASTSIYRTYITTIGETPLGDRRTFERLRHDSSKLMDEYMESLKYDKKWKLGDSIVRHFDLFESGPHEPAHFTIEQEVSMRILKSDRGSRCVIWLDTGSNLINGVKGPWNTLFDNKSFLLHQPYYPIVQHKENIALRPKSRIATCLKTPGSRQRGQYTTPGEYNKVRVDYDQMRTLQSASLLHLEYGRDLDRKLAVSHPFHAFHDIFALAASSELQFLNMMFDKVKLETSGTKLTNLEDATIMTLSRYKDTLKRHRGRIRENLDSIEASCTAQRPPGPSKSAPLAGRDLTPTELLEHDYRYLLSRAEDLLVDCDQGIKIMMNNSVIRESQQAILQAKEVAKLTRLAFFYIPLSFTSSFFGMNMVVFGSGGVSIWMWFVLSVPVLALSFIFLTYDVPRAIFQLCKKLASLGKKTDCKGLEEPAEESTAPSPKRTTPPMV